jgi:hypothetical protein
MPEGDKGEDQVIAVDCSDDGPIEFAERPGEFATGLSSFRTTTEVFLNALYTAKKAHRYG